MADESCKQEDINNSLGCGSGCCRSVQSVSLMHKDMRTVTYRAELSVIVPVELCLSH